MRNRQAGLRSLLLESRLHQIAFIVTALGTCQAQHRAQPAADPAYAAAALTHTPDSAHAAPCLPAHNQEQDSV